MKSRTLCALTGSTPASGPESAPGLPESVAVLPASSVPPASAGPEGLVLESLLQAARAPTATTDAANRRPACRLANAGSSLAIDRVDRPSSALWFTRFDLVVMGSL